MRQDATLPDFLGHPETSADAGPQAAQLPGRVAQVAQTRAAPGVPEITWKAAQGTWLDPSSWARSALAHLATADLLSIADFATGVHPMDK